jgi:autotransporter-associated beta strand protein
MTGDGSVIKRGAGTLTLTGDSTYTGETVVADGVLAIQNGSLPNTSALKIKRDLHIEMETPERRVPRRAS